MKKFYECYVGMTTDEDVRIGQEKDLDIISQLKEEMESDTENESIKLLKAYESAAKHERALMDYMCVCLCGWTMHTLIEKAAENENYDD